MARQTIPVTLTGAEYTWSLTITETEGKDISTVPFTMSMGTYDTPGTWVPPAIDTSPAAPVRVLQLLVNTSTLPPLTTYGKIYLINPYYIRKVELH